MIIRGCDVINQTVRPASHPVRDETADKGGAPIQPSQRSHSPAWAGKNQLSVVSCQLSVISCQ